MIVEVCGMYDRNDIENVARLGVDWIGIELGQSSPRSVAMVSTHAGIIPDKAPADLSETCTATTTADAVRKSVKRVGIFADEMAQNIITRVVNFRLDAVQMDGDEPPTLIDNLRRTIVPDLRRDVLFVKTVRIGSRDDLAACRRYERCADMLLLAPRRGEERFDWSLTDGYDCTLPFLIGGGIGPDDAEALRHVGNPRFAGISIGTRFETASGLKDTDRLQAFLAQL